MQWFRLVGFGMVSPAISSACWMRGRLIAPSLVHGYNSRPNANDKFAAVN
jgi:hypothetical protein